MTNGARIYLAGPDVFRRDARAWADQKRAVCARHGLVGVTPLDPLPDGIADDWGALAEWHRIALTCEAHILSCHALVANLTPFRGPSADPGTVYELGFARASGKPVFGYTANPHRFDQRTRDMSRTPFARDEGGVWRDGDGMALEQFGLTDNLMIDGAVASGGTAVVANSEEMAALTACVADAARFLSSGQAAAARRGTVESIRANIARACPTT